MNLRRWMQIALRAVMTLTVWTYTFAILLWLAQRGAKGDSPWYLALANSLAPYLFLGLIPAALLVVAARSRSAAIGWLVPATLAVAWFAPAFLPKASPVSANSGLRLKIMALNVNGSSGDPAGVLSRIRMENPDLILLQEVNPQYAPRLRTDLRTAYPYQVINEIKGSAGMGVLSRYPLRDRNWYALAGSTYAARWVTLSAGARTLEILNVHLRTSTLEPFSSESRVAFDRSFRTREQQARELIAFADAHAPALFGGDFNTPPTTIAYSLLRAGLTDSFSQAGWGLGGTFPAAWSSFAALPVPPALLRLDYVWHTRDLASEEAYVGEADGESDHLPILATVRWAER